jgi:leucyl-tRNA synthetase
MNKLIKKVGKDIEEMSFNTSISTMMETYNALVEMKRKDIPINWGEVWGTFLVVMAPFAPHMTEELWSTRVKGEGEREKVESIHKQPWPKYDPELVLDQTVHMSVQVNGRVRAVLELTADEAQDASLVRARALADPSVLRYATEETIKNVIFIRSRTINLVV